MKIDKEEGKARLQKYREGQWRSPRISRRDFGAFGLAGLAGLSLSQLPFGHAAQAQAQGDDVLEVAYGTIGPNRHPWMCGPTTDFDIANMLFDPLITMSPETEVVPVLAETIETLTPTQIRMTLREGIRFHDGKPLTVEDVKYSLELVKDKRAFTGFHYQNWFDRVEIIDDRTFVIEAFAPTRLALKAMGGASFILPKDSPLEGYVSPIGSGPFRFESFTPGGQLTALRNEDYWGEKPRYAKVVIRQIAEPSTRLAALMANEVAYADAISVDDIETVQQGGKTILSAPTTRLMYFGFNRTGDTPVQDVRVRRALHHAVDKAAIQAALFNGLGEIAQSVIPPRLGFTDPDLVTYDYDPEMARALLAEAGFGEGLEVTIAAPTNRYMRGREVAEALVGMFQDVGVSARLHLSDWSTYVAELSADRDAGSGKYMLWLWGWSAQPPDPQTSLGSLVAGSAYNMSGYASERFTQLLAATNQATEDTAEFHARLTEIQRLMWDEEAQMLGVLFMPQIVGISEDLAGLELRLDEYTRWAKV